MICIYIDRKRQVMLLTQSVNTFNESHCDVINSLHSMNHK